MAQALKEKADARIILHTVLGKIVKQLSCTTILIVEVPYGSRRIGMGMEEFVADGVLVFKRNIVEGKILRELELRKMRGVRLEHPVLSFHRRPRIPSPTEDSKQNPWQIRQI